MAETFIGYVSKYALTKGVQKMPLRESSHGFARPTTQPCWASFNEREWHRTEESALQRAEEMRKAKIASLQKQIAKLEKTTFTVKDPT